MIGEPMMKTPMWIAVSILFVGAFLAAPAVGFGQNAAPGASAVAMGQIAPVPSGDADKTLAALHDELQRSKDRLVLPGQQRPYFIEYRLLDLDERVISAEFGALLTSGTTRNRFMSVDVRVGNYKLDSSNFLSAEGFRGFLGSTGTVGIDRDYDSLRQDLWLATDQAYKEALDSYSNKQAALRALANAPTVDDFAQEPPVLAVDQRVEPDWTSRNWESEARTVSAILKNYPELYNSRVTYHLIYATSYVVTTEGTQIRTSRSLAAIEASLGTQSDDGMPLHNYLALYANRPSQLPTADAVRQQLDGKGKELAALRTAPPVKDYDGPMLFEPRAAGSLLAQVLAPSVSGARPPLSMNTRFEQMMQALGGRSEWMGRIGQRVLPVTVTLTDDPSTQEFQGRDLIASYQVDQDGVRAQKIALVQEGLLKELLMSRRPGPDLDHSNGHGRSAFLGMPRPMVSNLFFTASNGETPDNLRKKFLDACKQNGQDWGLLVREMDNPVIASSTQEELSDSLATLASGAPNGMRMPLMVYRVNVSDGHEELVRGALISQLTVRNLRTLLGAGNDNAVFYYAQSQDAETAGTALGAFGSANGGVPSDVIAPSLLFEEVEVRGPHGEPRRTPLVSPPPLQ